MGTDGTLMSSILELLEKYEAELVSRPPRDNQRVQQVWLQIWADGSGCIVAEYVTTTQNECPTRRMLRSVLTGVEEPIDDTGFDSLEQLHGYLVAETMETG